MAQFFWLTGPLKKYSARTGPIAGSALAPGLRLADWNKWGFTHVVYATVFSDFRPRCLSPAWLSRSVTCTGFPLGTGPLCSCLACMRI
jgi:hypothetical protein